MSSPLNGADGDMVVEGEQRSIDQVDRLAGPVVRVGC
jgi:hypothetical protein